MDGHSPESVDHTVPTALSQDPHAVILKVSEAERTAREHSISVWKRSVIAWLTVAVWGWKGFAAEGAQHWSDKPKMGMIEPNMGTNATASTPHSLTDALFSGTKQRVLGILYGQPTRSFYANEVISLAASGSGSVQRELATLANSGLVTVKSVGNQKHYQANAESPIFAELCSIIQKTTGLAEPLRRALAPLTSKITAAFVYGSVAKKTDTASSDIDLMLISEELGYGDLFSALEDASVKLGRQVNPTILTREEFGKRLANQESFLTRVMGQPKIWVVGESHDLGI
jgi:hypothetical protein